MKTTTQALRTGALILGIGAAVLGIPAGSSAFSVYDSTQDVQINSNAYNQVLFFEFNTGAASLSTVALGNRVIHDALLVVEDSFTGAFLYDFALESFTTAMYTTKQTP